LNFAREQMVHLGELKLEEKTKGILLLGACSIASYKCPLLVGRGLQWFETTPHHKLGYGL
jgi:hypothetical protein